MDSSIIILAHSLFFFFPANSPSLSLVYYTFLFLGHCPFIVAYAPSVFLLFSVSLLLVYSPSFFLAYCPTSILTYFPSLSSWPFPSSSYSLFPLPFLLPFPYLVLGHSLLPCFNLSYSLLLMINHTPTPSPPLTLVNPPSLS